MTNIDNLKKEREEKVAEIEKLDKAIRVMLVDYITAVRELKTLDDELIK